MSETQMSPGMAKMYAFARRQPLATLAASLLKLDAPKDEAERLTCAVLMDVIREKSPAEPETEPCLMCGEPSVPVGKGPLCERCEAAQDAEA